jgi:hypothetical protein
VRVDEIEIVLDDGANRVAMGPNVVVQVRHGEQSTTALDLMVATFRARKRQSDHAFFGLFVVEESAPIPAPPVRKRQIEVIGEILGSGRVHAALVLEGSGVMADLKRVVLRTLSDARLPIHKTVAEAIRSLAKYPGAPPAAALQAVVDAARDRSRASHSQGRIRIP